MGKFKKIKLILELIRNKKLFFPIFNNTYKRERHGRKNVQTKYYLLNHNI